MDQDDIDYQRFRKILAPRIESIRSVSPEEEFILASEPLYLAYCSKERFLESFPNHSYRGRQLDELDEFLTRYRNATPRLKAELENARESIERGEDAESEPWKESLGLNDEWRKSLSDDSNSQGPIRPRPR